MMVFRSRDRVADEETLETFISCLSRHMRLEACHID
jgi:hypothetical protein